MAELHVNTAAVLQNYRTFAEGGMVIPVLKDNACGLGARRMLELLKAEGVRLFAVGTPEEALRLSHTGADLLLLASVQEPELLQKLIRQDVILSVESLRQAEAVDRLGMEVRVHLCVDTGFGRFGFLPTETAEMKAVFRLPHLHVCGVYSHFRSASSAEQQFARFLTVLDALEGYDVGLRHIAATSTALDARFRLDAVRVGTGLTGRCMGLEPASTMTAQVCSIRRLPRGSRIGYTGTRLLRETEVAIVDAGTADGAFLRRCCGLRSLLRLIRRRVEYGGRDLRVLGTPGLTHTAVDVTGMNCRVGDFVTIRQTPALVSPAVPRKYI